MPFDDEIRNESERIFDSMRISIGAQASRTAITLQEFIEGQRVLGLSKEAIENLLLDDLANGGRIFGEFNRSLGLNIEGSLGQLPNSAAEIRFGRDPKRSKTWIAALVNTCPDCLPRHGEVDSLRNWEIRGKPRTGWSVCRKHCQCVLLDTSDVKGRPELDKPLIRTKVKT